MKVNKIGRKYSINNYRNADVILFANHQARQLVPIPYMLNTCRLYALVTFVCSLHRRGDGTIRDAHGRLL